MDERDFGGLLRQCKETKSLNSEAAAMQGNGPKGSLEWGLSHGPLPHGQLSHTRRRHGSTLPAVLFEAIPIPFCWDKPGFSFPENRDTYL